MGSSIPASGEDTAGTCLTVVAALEESDPRPLLPPTGTCLTVVAALEESEPRPLPPPTVICFALPALRTDELGEIDEPELGIMTCSCFEVSFASSGESGETAPVLALFIEFEDGTDRSDTTFGASLVAAFAGMG